MNPRAIATVFRREFGAYFSSPIAYVFLIAFVLIPNSLFMFFYQAQRQLSMRDYFGLLPFVFLFFVPAITMRLWSEERRAGSIEILLTLPVRVGEAVLGKFLAAYAFLVIAIASTLTIPISMTMFGAPDWGPITGAYLGAILMGGLFLALGAYISSLATNQIVAFIIAVSLSFLLVFTGFGFVREFLGGISSALADAASYVSVMTHFDNIAKGVVDTSDVIYYLSFIFLFLFLNVYAIQSHRYAG
jgi:ABC-2 type transport system permease protein